MAVSEEECSSAKCRSSSYASSTKAHYLAKCVLRGSVVLQVLYGHIRCPSSLDVVFGKETSIELVIVGEDGVVQSVCEQTVFGTIKDIALLPWNDRFEARNPQMLGKDLLIVISDSGKLSVLSFCNEMHRFFPVTHIQLSNAGNLRYQLGRMLAVDPSGCFIAVSAYAERVVLFTVSMSHSSNIIDEKIICPPENEEALGTSTSKSLHRYSVNGTIWSMCFISQYPNNQCKENNPLLAIILNRRGSILNELLLLQWNIRDRTAHVISTYVESGPLAHCIFEVPHSYGYAFLFRVGDALLMDLRDPHKPSCVYRTSLNFLPPMLEEQTFVEDSSRLQDVDDEGLFNVAACALLELKDYDPMCIDGDNDCASSSCKYMCSSSWAPVNDTNSKLIFCVDTGEFFMIEILFDSDGPKVNLSECLYKGIACKSLLWVEGGYLAALAEMGDGMVLKLENGKLQYTSSIQNIAPILDTSVVNYPDEKHDQMFACCGVAPEGSLRIIRSGISVEKLLRTAPIYQGIIGTWTVQMRVDDLYHSFLVLSFVEETRILSVGLSFADVTDSVGFQSNVSTLACGLVNDGLLIQIYQSAVRLCIPSYAAHAGGIPLSSPIYTSWSPPDMSISLGAVGHNFIVVSTSNPCFLFILGVRMLSAYHYEVYEMQRIRLQNELSCISVPRKPIVQKQSTLPFLTSGLSGLPIELDFCNTFVIGTHRPSVEVLSFVSDRGLRVLAHGLISLTNTMGTTISGCIPQDVRLVYVDRLYVLSGLRNGMLLRFEWSPASMTASADLARQSAVTSLSSNVEAAHSNINFSNSQAPSISKTNLSQRKDDMPVTLQMIAIRRIGITPVFLVPLSDSLDSDIIALSDRPWLFHSARHSLSYTSISFQPSTHVTPVCSPECPNGILFVSDSCLHLVEMVHSKRLNVQKFHLGGTPRKVLYHSESRLLLVMRTDLNEEGSSSDICCVDPLSGLIQSFFKFEHGETGKSMELVKVGNEEVLVVGTSLSSGPAIMPSGEAESTKGRLLVLCLEHVQNSDSGSMTFGPKTGSSSQRTSPFHDIAGYTSEQMSSGSHGSSPDDASCDGIKLDESETWQLRLAHSTTWPGMVLAVCRYLNNYFLASAGNAFFVCGFPTDNPQKVKKLAVGRTRFMITSLAAHFTRIAVGDCRDGILFFSYQEDARKLEQLYCDPCQRLVADCILTDVDTAVVSDRKGSIAFLSASDQLEENASPECNLKLSCAYYMSEVAMSIRKGSYAYRLPADDVLPGCDTPDANIGTPQNTIIASTLLGSIVIFIPLSREEYELLEAVEARLAVHPLTAPILGNDHSEFRGRENPVGVPKVLDGDMLTQFLELTSIQQEGVLSLPPGSNGIGKGLKPFSASPIGISEVVQLLERLHYALN